MKFTTAILALAGIASAQQANYLRVIATRSASPIHFLPLTARNHELWLGGNTATYCPENVASLGGCPVGNTTSFVEYNGHLSMGAVVPGGQYVFIDRCSGAVGYTVAHSGATPEGAIVDGWSYTPGADGSLGTLSYKDGLIACPEGNEWQVFAQVEGVSHIATCLGFDALTTNSSAPTAWQYS